MLGQPHELCVVLRGSAELEWYLGGFLIRQRLQQTELLVLTNTAQAMCDLFLLNKTLVVIPVEWYEIICFYDYLFF
jgi:hypothetical protein